MQVIRKVVTAWRARGPVEVLREIRWRMHSETVAFGLRRDLRVPFSAPQAAVPLSIRPMRDADVPVFFNPNAGELSQGDLAYRRRLLESGIPTGYVAETADGRPCYMQWLIGPQDGERLQQLFGDSLPRLGPDEALLENAYTLEACRGLRIMPCAMAQIAEKGEGLGARWVLTFVHEANTPSLKGCKRAGFEPYLLARDRWLLFRRSIAFTRLPDGTPYPFESGAGARLSVGGSTTRANCPRCSSSWPLPLRRDGKALRRPTTISWPTWDLMGWR